MSMTAAFNKFLEEWGEDITILTRTAQLDGDCEEITVD